MFDFFNLLAPASAKVRSLNTISASKEIGQKGLYANQIQ